MKKDLKCNLMVLFIGYIVTTKCGDKKIGEHIFGENFLPVKEFISKFFSMVINKTLTRQILKLQL